MPRRFDRQSALKSAEKALRQGKIQPAIKEYQQIVAADRNDWNSANVLGDLYIKARQIDKGVAEFARIADHLAEEGFHAKASALYKKILKINPDHEYATERAGEMAARLGLLADARTAFQTLADRRRKRGDNQGAAALERRIIEWTSTDPELTAQPTPPSPVSSPPSLPKSLDEVFGQIREQTEQAPTEQSASEQYRLAVTYRELGMLDDAMHALEEAVRSPRERFAAATLLARINLDRDEPQQAIEWFERALEAPAPTTEASRALRYDLASTLDRVGEHGRALAVFLELEAQSRGYRDVALQIDRLSQLQAKG